MGWSEPARRLAQYGDPRKLERSSWGQNKGLRRAGHGQTGEPASKGRAGVEAGIVPLHINKDRGFSVRGQRGPWLSPLPEAVRQNSSVQSGVHATVSSVLNTVLGPVGPLHVATASRSVEGHWPHCYLGAPAESSSTALDLLSSFQSRI